MAIVTTDNQYYTAIANAINDKLGTSTPMYPREMAAKIASIAGGTFTVVFNETSYKATKNCNIDVFAFGYNDTGEIMDLTCTGGSLTVANNFLEPGYGQPYSYQITQYTGTVNANQTITVGATVVTTLLFAIFIIH